MDQEQKDILFKARSYRSVLAEGIRLYTNNFRKFFKASWLMATLYALVGGLTATLITLKIPAIIVAVISQIQKYHGIFIQPLQHFAWIMLAIIGLIIVTILVMAVANGTIANLLKEHQETGSIPTPASWLKPSTKMMGRTVKGVSCTFGIAATVIIIETIIMTVIEIYNPSSTLETPITLIGLMLIVNSLLSLLALPLFYILTKYVLGTDKGYWHTLRSSYGLGMRHWGMLFLVSFVSILLITISELIILLPANILFSANYMAQMGQLYGDPLGMPSYMTPLTYITYVLCFFMLFYAQMLLMLHNYYAYGSIEAKEQERQQQRLDILS